MAEGLSRSERGALGIPIGNLTSQLFANVYLHEFDRFVVHHLKPQAYLRYGDDFILVGRDRSSVEHYRAVASAFLLDQLFLSVHRTNDVVVPARRGLHFLGLELHATTQQLRPRTAERVRRRLTLRNVASYHDLVERSGDTVLRREFPWLIEAFL